MFVYSPLRGEWIIGLFAEGRWFDRATGDEVELRRIGCVCRVLVDRPTVDTRPEATSSWNAVNETVC